MAGERSDTGEHFALDIMGGNAGMLKGFDGLQMEADVVTDPGPAIIPKKHVANIRWTPATATIGIGMGKELHAVIQRAFAAQQKPFDGALHVTDFNYRIQSSLNFSGAIMTRASFTLRTWRSRLRAGRSQSKLAGRAQDPRFQLRCQHTRVRQPRLSRTRHAYYDCRND